MDRFTIKVKWDAEASVWYVEDTDVPGLVVEDESFEGQVEKIKALAPELLDLNRHLLDGKESSSLPFHVMAEQLLEIPNSSTDGSLYERSEEAPSGGWLYIRLAWPRRP